MNALETHPEVVSNYRNNDIGGSKVALKAKNLSHLLKAYDQAKSSGLPCALITDSGHVLPPHFDGNPIVTALGIGPCTKDLCKHITKRFRCI